MEITVKLWDELEEEMVFWTFRVNANGYIDIVIEGKIMDTLLEIGEVRNMGELLSKVNELLEGWKIRWESKRLLLK